MKKLILFIGTMFLLGCTNETKDKYLKEIKALKEKIATQESAIEVKDKEINTLVNSNKYNEDEFKESKDWIESREEVYKTLYAIDVTKPNNVFTDFYDTIDYQATGDDSYSKRGIYYVSESRNEYYYNVRVSVIDNKLKFFFMGVNFPLSKDNLIATIYELDANKNLFIIDTIDLSSGQDLHEDHDNKLTLYLEELMQLHADNLIVQNENLYYFKTDQVKTAGEAGLKSLKPIINML